MGKWAWGPPQLVSQGVPMPLLQGGPWARGPRGLEGSFPPGPQLVPLGLVVSLGCPSSWLLPRGVGLPSPPISSLPLTLLSSPGPGLIVMELGGFGWEGPVRNRWEALFFPKGLGTALEPGHFLGPGRTLVTTLLWASGAVRGSV